MDRSLRRSVVLGWVLLDLMILGACSTPSNMSPTATVPTSVSGSATPEASPGPSSSIAAPTPSVSPTMTSRPSTAPSEMPRVVAGSDAWIAVAIATGWHAADSPRRVDAPALANPPRIRAWLAALTQSQQGALIGLMDTQVLLGERVRVVSVAAGWARVVVPNQPSPLDPRGYPAWVPLAQLSAVAPPKAATEASVVTPTTWLRSESGHPIAEISFATRLPILRANGTHLEVGLPGRGRAWLDASDVVVIAAGAAALPGTGQSIVESARAFIGLRYLWSGTSGFGFDCSGLVHLVYREHGITLPRDADAQARTGSIITRRALKPGDLVFFARSGVVHHVAIYAGDGQLIDAPNIAMSVRTYALATVSSAEHLSYRRVLSVGQP
jgi:gamma-D-glutamyl-L-lysine dipeptidyl-peptidase